MCAAVLRVLLGQGDLLVFPIRNLRRFESLGNTGQTKRPSIWHGKISGSPQAVHYVVFYAFPIDREHGRFIPAEFPRQTFRFAPGTAVLLFFVGSLQKPGQLLSKTIDGLGVGTTPMTILRKGCTGTFNRYCPVFSIVKAVVDICPIRLISCSFWALRHRFLTSNVAQTCEQCTCHYSGCISFARP